MKIVESKSLGFCGECHKNSKERQAAIETKDGRKLCAIHLVSEALIDYSSNHFKLKQKQQIVFRDNVLLKLINEVIYNIDEKAKDELGIL